MLFPKVFGNGTARRDGTGRPSITLKALEMTMDIASPLWKFSPIAKIGGWLNTYFQ